MLKHGLRLIKFTLIFLLVLLPLQLAGAIILLFVCPFMPKNRLKLPACLKWFDNADAYVGRDTSIYQMVCESGWWARYKWLAWRNPINYFGYIYCGLRWDGTEVYLRYNPAEDNVGDTTNDRPGFRHIEVAQGNLNYFEYYWIYRYPFKPDTCFRYRLGWKISDNKNRKGSISQWVYVISPFKTYSGR